MNIPDTFHESLEYIQRKTIDILNTVTRDDSEKINNLFFKANRIFVYGAGRSGLVSKAFAIRLVHLGFQTFVIGETIGAPVKKGGLVCIVSGSGETIPAVMTAEIAKNLEATLMVVTGKAQSRITKFADIAIVLAAECSEKKRKKFAPCPVCGAAKAEFELIDEPEPPAPAPSEPAREPKSVDDFRRASDELETSMADIRRMALTGESVIEPMRSRKPSVSWDDILIKGAQLARQPLNADETVDAKTVIGPRAAKPLVIGTPIIVSHMSFGALSREAQSALALGSGAMGTAMSSGEGGILEDALDMAHKFIFEYVPNRYSVDPKYLRRVDAIEIKASAAVSSALKRGLGR